MASTSRADTWSVRVTPGALSVSGTMDQTTKTNTPHLVLYHQPEKMVRSKEDIQERQENLERLKQQHGIE
jgi:hypothetical protein